MKNKEDKRRKDFLPRDFDKLNEKVKEEMGEKVIKCPKCDVEMKKLSNGKFIIDKCPQCEGVFLDKEEINNINKQGFINYIRNYFRRD